VIHNVTEDSIVDLIEAEAKTSLFVIVDLEGTANLMVANAIGRSDLVLIPAEGSSMDARGGAKTIRLIYNQSRMARRMIPHCVVLTRTSVAVRSRTLKTVHERLVENGIEVLRTGICSARLFAICSILAARFLILIRLKSVTLAKPLKTPGSSRAR